MPGAGCTGEMGPGEALLFCFHAGITNVYGPGDDSPAKGETTGGEARQRFVPREGLMVGFPTMQGPGERMASVHDAAARTWARSG